MKSERVSCLTADCSYCQHGIKAGKTFYWGDSLYICKAHPKKHRIVENLDAINLRTIQFCVVVVEEASKIKMRLS